MKNVIVFLRPNCYFKTKEALNEKRIFAMNTKEVLGRGKEHVVLLQAKATVKLMTNLFKNFCS